MAITKRQYLEQIKDITYLVSIKCYSKKRPTCLIFCRRKASHHHLAYLCCHQQHYLQQSAYAKSSFSSVEIARVPCECLARPSSFALDSTLDKVNPLSLWRYLASSNIPPSNHIVPSLGVIPYDSSATQKCHFHILQLSLSTLAYGCLILS